MDKLNPTFQATNLVTKDAEYVSTWYTTESTSGVFSDSQVAWLQAQGWSVFSSVTVGGSTTYFMSRRRMKAETVLQALVDSYIDAYNEGRTLNDQRYDDLLTMFVNSLSSTEDEYNALETDDDTYEGVVEGLFTLMTDEYTTWSADVDWDLDQWGTDLLAEINARFDARLSAENQKLVDRRLYNTTLAVTATSAVERERQRALNQANDTIEQRQLELKNKIFAEQVSLRSRLLAARDRLRVFLHNAKDQQVSMRERAANVLARLVEGRTDSYPEISEIGRLAASLGAGTPEAYGQ